MTDQKEVLIVDDSDENVVFVSQIIEDCGHRFRVARNGKEAMVALFEKAPDLVLLDIMMPRKSGISVYREMKASPQLEKVPVVIITGTSEITGVDVTTGTEQPKRHSGDDLARDFGAIFREKLRGITPEGFIEKPIDPSLLSETVQKLLS